MQVTRITDRWREDSDEIRESVGDVEDNVARVEEDCKAKGMQIDVLSDQERRAKYIVSCQFFNPKCTLYVN